VSDAARWFMLTERRLPADWWDTWDRLNGSSMEFHPLLASSMVKELVAHFGERTLRFAELRSGKRTLAQTIVHGTAVGRWTLFAPSQAPIAPFVFDRSISGNSRHIYTLLTGLIPALALHVPYQDPLYSLLPPNPTPRITHQHLGTTIAISAPEGFEPYWSTRPRDLRQNVRRYMKRAESNGLSVSLEVSADPESIGKAVDRFGELESQGWKGREGTALHPENAQGRFYRKLLTTLAAAGQAWAFELRLGQQLAASRLLIGGPTMYVMLKTTYAEELRQYAPGRILLHLCLADLLNRNDGPRRVEFYTRANADMLSWGTHTREMFSATLYRFPLLATLSTWRARRCSNDLTTSD